MHIFLFTAGAQNEQLDELETRLRSRLPTLTRLAKLDEVAQQLANGSAEHTGSIYIVFPVLTDASSMERLVSIAENHDHRLFFIFVSREIAATDYKRLVRRGNAEWASIDTAPDEIAEIIARPKQQQPTSELPSPNHIKPAIASFVPSGGGVGNTTLAIESAVQLKSAKATGNRRVCLLDLDLQTSHACDYLDIEPRLQMAELVEHPERLDAQLFDLFVSHHNSGLDVLAAPRRRDPGATTSIAALDALFQIIAMRYELVIVDLPVAWSQWTAQILSVSDLVFVTGVNNVAGLRQISETLAAVRALATVPPQIVTVVNHCEPQLFGGIARKQHVARVLGAETIIYVREDANVIGSVNMGIPMAIGNPSSKASKDIRALTSMLAKLSPQRVN